MTDPLGLIGQSLGAYTVGTFRGEGAFGVVHEGASATDPTGLALKILRPGALPQAQLEFDNEGAMLVRLSSASRVVDILDTRTEIVPLTFSGGGTMHYPMKFHVLELADGCLADLVANLGDLDWPTRLSLFRDVVLGVHQMHGRRMVHRDLKGANVLVFDQGDQVVAKLNDLGRARDLAAPPSSTARYDLGRGDPNFAAPEFLWGAGEDSTPTHVAADLYGLGSMFVELCTGFGLTSLAVGPHLGLAFANRALPAPNRQLAYRNRVAEVRSWFGPYFELVENSLPPSIRQLGGRLVRQLCDPDPELRFPRIAPGRRGERPHELAWLLSRVDSMTISLKNAMRDAERIAKKKAARS